LRRVNIGQLSTFVSVYLPRLDWLKKSRRFLALYWKKATTNISGPPPLVSLCTGLSALFLLSHFLVLNYIAVIKLA